MKIKRNTWLFLGIFLVIFTFIFQGLSIISQTAEHVREDITTDLLPHLFLLGIILIAYALYSRRGK